MEMEMEMDHRLTDTDTDTDTNTDTDDGAEDSYSVVLELAASDNLDGFKAAVERDPSAVDLVGLWFCRVMGSNQMGLQHRTPLMVAATYGSVHVLRLILDISGAPVDRCCGPDKATALHCAASGGSSNAVDTVNVLLSAGADPDSVDAAGRRPSDVVAVPAPELSDSKVVLEGLLGSTVSTSPSGSSSPSSADDDGSLSSDSTASSPTATAANFQPPEKKEYPVDPSLPDIKNSIYATDEFRMYQFKIRPCSRAYTHDWTECPFVHPGENARRRDPRKYNYSCVPCPDFRKGSCSRGDSCDYAHGVFECWLHPAQYRTRLCKDGTSCSRRVCFFAHTTDELRTISSSAAPTPRSSRALEMEMAMAMLSLLPGSPSAAVMSPSPFSLPISPATNTMCNSSIGWMQQPNVPMLQLPISNLQSSRLCSSLRARDIPVNDFSLILDLDHQQLDETCFSPSKARYGYFGGDGNCHVRPKTLTSSNLDGLFSAEISSSPRYNADQGGALFSPSHKTALLHQLHHQHLQQQQSLLSPIKTGLLSPKPVDPLRHSSLLQATHEMLSPSRMSPRGVEHLSPFSPQLVALTQREKLQQHLRSLSALDVSSGISDGISPTIGSPVNSSWPKWDSPKGKLDWSMNCEELERLKASSVDLGSGCEDVSWVQPLVSTPEEEKKLVVTSVDAHLNSNSLMQGHAVLESWLDRMQLDQVVDK